MDEKQGSRLSKGRLVLRRGTFFPGRRREGDLDAEWSVRGPVQMGGEQAMAVLRDGASNGKVNGLAVCNSGSL